MAELLMARSRRASDRVVRRVPGFAGTAGAIVCFGLSMTPSLLPRPWQMQAVVSAIAMASGYAVAAGMLALVRTVHPTPVPRRSAWVVLAVAAAGTAVAFGWLGALWQTEIRQLLGLQPAPWWHPVPAIGFAVAGFIGLLLLARIIRLVTRRIATMLHRFSPRPVASIAAVGMVAAVSYGIGPALAFPGLVDLADRAAAAANAGTPAGVAEPDSPYVSGGPGTLVPWETLGAYGREFTAGVLDQPQLDAFSGGDSLPPIRVYVGRDSVRSVAAQAHLAVRELERTGAFERSVLAIVGTTGTGWVNPAAAQALEYLYNGDTALVATQYSYLPSWLSFLADRSLATQAAEELIDAVRQRLARIPAAERPQLVIYGESLGSHGVESAVSDLGELLKHTDGAVLAGPPNTNPIWRDVVTNRDPDSPMWRPEPGGDGAVCFGSTGPELTAEPGAEPPVERPTEPSAGPGRPELVYLQNGSDPVVWWNPELLYRKPQWLDGDRAPDVTGAMRWFPVITFWQVSADLVGSNLAPAGHGHHYREAIVDAWVAQIPPPDWTDADTQRLRDQLSRLDIR